MELKQKLNEISKDIRDLERLIVKYELQGETKLTIETKCLWITYKHREQELLKELLKNDMPF